MMPAKLILGVLSVPLNIHPVKLTGMEPGLYNSIHSSLEEAAVPAQATSLIIKLRKPAGVAVLVGEGVSVAVAVLVGVGVSVGDDVNVAVGVGSPQVVIGLDEFCGLLGLRRKKSEALLFESMQLPDPSS